MAMTLNDFYDRVVYLNLVIYMVYFVIKYVVALVLLCIIAKWWKDSMTPVEWVVFVIFGKLLGSKEGRVPLETTENMSRHSQIMILFIIVVAFVVLAVGTALDLSLFSTSSVCTEDLRYDCYPQLISGANKTGLNITTDEPVRDCSFWNSDSVSNRVTFVCYQKDFNFDLFLAATGGLLALGFFIMKTMIGLLLGCARCLVQKWNCNATCVYVMRIILAIGASVTELGILVLCLVFGATRLSRDDTSDPPDISFLVMNSAEILVVFGITATLFWLPWEEYKNAIIDTYGDDTELRPTF